MRIYTTEFTKKFGVLTVDIFEGGATKIAQIIKKELVEKSQGENQWKSLKKMKIFGHISGV